MHSRFLSVFSKVSDQKKEIEESLEIPEMNPFGKAKMSFGETRRRGDKNEAAEPKWANELQ